MQGWCTAPVNDCHYFLRVAIERFRMNSAARHLGRRGRRSVVSPRTRRGLKKSLLLAARLWQSPRRSPTDPSRERAEEQEASFIGFRNFAEGVAEMVARIQNG
jgi:hypothetical protein